MSEVKMSEQTDVNDIKAPPSQNGPVEPSFSWLHPHPVFVIILIGPNEHPFGIQKDFLCEQSEYFKDYFASRDKDTVEHLVKLPDATEEVFGLAQNYMFTGHVVADSSKMPSYEALVGLWRLGHKLGIDGLCERTLEAMIECRRLTQRIPSTPLLIQVWKDTPEGSTIRKLLLSWAAEYMRASDARAEFAKSLPQEVLSELVVTMSSFDNVPVVQAPVGSPPRALTSGLRKNVHYLEEHELEHQILTPGGSLKRRRRTRSPQPAPVPAPTPTPVPAATPIVDTKPAFGRKASRTSFTALQKQPKRRSSTNTTVEGRSFSTVQKIDFCADLLTRMLSGPGFWTRLVGPFKEPVVPADDGVPDYFDKVKKPMDLSTIKGKMDRREYADEEEFAADMRQIFENCFLYWRKTDPMWAAGEKLQKTFEEKYAGMQKWLAKMAGDEGD